MGNKPSQVDAAHPKRTKFILYSDFTCPYCYLEYVRLSRAIEKLPKDKRPVVTHGAFQMDDTLPSEGVDKYGLLSTLIPQEALDQMIDILCSQFRDLGMEMNPRGLIGNSAPAHRLQIWAEEHLPLEQSHKLKGNLFQIHSCQGKSMSDTAAILDAAQKAGLTDQAQIRSILQDPKYDKKFKKIKKHARKVLQIESVPCLLVVDTTGKRRILEEATDIETVEGFSTLVAQNI